ncbi:MFS transporter [Pseudonocardia sp. CA-142604]|uniref:MFS transporter n=1 Tax=Pseudonocardia sp. CA-142604 TaxID=3240024 RepID=UPI003D90ED5C
MATLATVTANALIFSGMTSIAVILPSFQDEFDVSRGAVNWVVIGALLPIAALVTVSGRLGDLFGRRRLFVAGMILYGLASLVCALTPSAGLLIGGRLLQGIGAALVLPLALTNLTEMLPAAHRGWAVSTMAAGTTVATTIAPLLLAFLVTSSGWRWLFWTDVSVSLIVIAVARRYVIETRGPPGQSLDLRGVLLLSAGLAFVVLACERSDYWGIRHFGTLGLFASGLLLLGAFVRFEYRVADPLIDLRQLRNATISASLTCLATMQGAALAVTVFLMLYLQQVIDLTPAVAGLLMLPGALGALLFFPLAGRLTDRGSARWLLVGGLLAGAAAMIWLSSGADRGEGPLLIPPLVILGAATACVYIPASTLTLTHLPEQSRGVAAGLTIEARQIGGVVGLAVLTALLTALEWRSRDRLLSRSDTDFTVAQQEAIDSLLFEDARSPLVTSMPPELRSAPVAAANEAFVDGLQGVLLTGAAGLAVTALFAALAIHR